jgi:preprotein translocase subunit SecA
LFSNYISTEQIEENWDVEGLHYALKSDYAADFPLQEWLDEGLDIDELESRVEQGLAQIFDYKEEIVGSEQMRGNKFVPYIIHTHQVVTQFINNFTLIVRNIVIL